jgi:hypothetical protein
MNSNWNGATRTQNTTGGGALTIGGSSTTSRNLLPVRLARATSCLLETALDSKAIHLLVRGQHW